MLLAATSLGAPSCPPALPADKSLAVTQTAETLNDAVRARQIPIQLFVPQGEGPWPLVTLNHGAGMGVAGYTYLGTGLASRGYVVAGFDEYVAKGTQLDYMLDIAGVRDSLMNASDSGVGKFAGLLCDQALGVGHSLGGGAQFVAADSEVCDCLTSK